MVCIRVGDSWVVAKNWLSRYSIVFSDIRVSVLMGIEKAIWVIIAGNINLIKITTAIIDTATSAFMATICDSM
jgi:hypothetical protein